ncbi:hypothetical protein [Gracilimonas mengyeensis]|nr:hypothetical protein [Gracilimonas mengyeensis]
MSLLLSPGLVFAQNSSEPTHSAGWVNTGLGFGTGGVTLIGGASRQIDHHIFSVRGTTSTELFNYNGDNIWDLGILYGWATTSQTFHLSASAGFGMIGGVYRKGGLFSGEPDENIPLTPGLPLEFNVSWRSNRQVGFGWHYFANLNQERSFIGMAFTLQIGRLW